MNPNSNLVNEFKPSSEYIELFLSTRKTPRVLPYGFTMPGYFHTDHYKRDKNWFNLAIFIELLAFFLTVNGGYSRGGEWGFIAILTALFFIVFDIVGAQLLHNKVSKKCRYLNLAVIEKDPIAAEGFIKEAKAVNGKQILGYCLIIFSAFLKYFALFLLGSFKLSILSIIILLYLIVIYIHIYHTGYFFAEFKRIQTLKKEQNLFRKELMLKAQGLSIESQFQASTIIGQNSIGGFLRLNLPEGHVSYDGHKLIETIIGPDLYSYRLETKGLLTDEQIISFTQNQNEEQCKFILNLCIAHQINNYY
jgi:hypothetical protein